MQVELSHAETGTQVVMNHHDLPCTNQHGPSMGFICAVSEFLDTDPGDLLVELGYYNAEAAVSPNETQMNFLTKA
jgi:hypothetical protein